MTQRTRQTPVVQLTTYQKAWVQDHARFKHGRWARQSGKTFATALEIADDCHRRRTKWVMLSRGERQSRENMEQVAVHCKAYGAAAEILETSYPVQDAVYKVLEIRLPNGSRVLGLPANPDTARGHAAHVYLDEFAFHQDSRKIWSALFPTITRGFRLLVTSTPQGKSNKFYELESNDQFAHHKVDIYDAIAGGLALKDDTGQPITPEALRLALGDEDAWQQEYLVQYVDEATAFLTYELIASCEDDLATMGASPASSRGASVATDATTPWTRDASLFLGMDIGRKRDLSVIWVLEALGDVLWTRAVEILDRAPFSVQRAALFAWLPVCQRAAIDATGLGMQLAEEAQQEFGSTVEPVTFNVERKEVLSVTLRRQFEDRTVRIPADRAIREDLHRIKRVPSPTGHFRYDAARNEEGHCYDAETEILTAEGWASFPDLRPGLAVATLEAGHLVFRAPEAYQRFPFDGELVRIENIQVDLRVTPNHRLYVAPRGMDQFGFITAKDLIGRRERWQFKRDAQWEGTDPAIVEISGESLPAEWWAEFLGYFLAQGFTSSRNLCGIYGKRIATDRMGECIRRCPWHFWLDVPKSGNCSSFRARIRALHQYLSAFGKQPERFIPRECLAWSPRLLTILLDAMLYGNGRTDKQWSYDTTSRRLADDIQELLLRVGLAGSIVEWQPSLAGKNVRRIYRVNINRMRLTPEINRRRKSWSLERYRGWVYCCTVPSGVIYVRRNGKGVWCSNSDRYWSLALAVGAAKPTEDEPRIRIIRPWDPFATWVAPKTMERHFTTGRAA